MTTKYGRTRYVYRVFKWLILGYIMHTITGKKLILKALICFTHELLKLPSAKLFWHTHCKAFSSQVCSLCMYILMCSNQFCTYTVFLEVVHGMQEDCLLILESTFHHSPSIPIVLLECSGYAKLGPGDTHTCCDIWQLKMLEAVCKAQRL